MGIINLFNSLTALQKSLVVAIAAIVLFITSAGVSFSVVYSTIPSSKTQELASSLPSPTKALEEDPNEPKSESCPLNGAMHTKKAKDNWQARRPLAVMIENHVEARPQSGLSSADIVYEAVAEGGITRFMAIFLCNLSDIQTGPVRSARTYYLDWVSSYDALYAHVGGANTPGPADALGQIIKFKLKALNQFSTGFPTFWRDYQRLGHPVATEHTMYSTTQKLWDVGAKRGWIATDNTGRRWDEAFIPWKFKDSSSGTSLPDAKEISVSFWQNQPDYEVSWKYDESCNCYKRKNGGTDHLDLNNKQQLSAKNVIVQFIRESNAFDGYEGNVHLLYRTTGSGKALMFIDGKVIEGQWVKLSRTVREKFLDSNGREVGFNRGIIWIQTVPEGAKISY